MYNEFEIIPDRLEELRAFSERESLRVDRERRTSAILIVIVGLGVYGLSCALSYNIGLRTGLSSPCVQVVSGGGK